MSVRPGAPRAVLSLRPQRKYQDGRTEYLSAELKPPGREPQDTWTTDAAAALVLDMYARPTMGEQPRVDAMARDIAGGFGPLQDAQDALQMTGIVVEAELVASLWPDGRPEPADEDETAAQEAAINAAFRTHQSEARSAHLDARDIADRIAFLAHHAVLHVRERTPPPWRRIAQLELSRGAAMALLDAWRTAQEESSQGNG